MDTNTNKMMNATATTSKKFAFTYDHVNQKIVGTDINFQKAGIPDSKEEAELLARMAKQPTYTFRVIETEKKPAKQTYKGLTKELMREYIAIQEESAKADLNARLDKMLAEKNAFSTIKSWFLDEFKEFSVSKAKREIQQFRLNSTKDKVKAIKVSVSTKTPSSQVIDMPKVPAPKVADLLDVG